MDGNEIKLATFAYDITSFVRDRQSHITLLDVMKSFNRYLGLMINQDKTEAFYLEITHQIAQIRKQSRLKKSIKLLGGSLHQQQFTFFTS